MPDELAEHLDALKRDDCYRVDAVLKQSPYETTERVFFKGENESELGPFVRKLIDREAGIGSAYESIRAAQRAGRRFRHLPRIIDCYEAGPCLVVVMEHIGGETLADVVYRCDASVALACDVFPRLCDAVAELHEGFPAPIIHRDLKPSNVMLSRDSMTIIDFGIARAYKEESDEDTRRFGTRAYAPPEQFGYGQTDVRSDVYALGMLLYFCLTEKTPDAKTRKDGFRAAEVPEPLRRVIVRATAFDPADRYASAAELKRAFLAASGMPAPDAPPQIDAPAAYEPPAAAAVGAPSARPRPLSKRQPWRREPRTAFREAARARSFRARRRMGRVPGALLRAHVRGGNDRHLRSLRRIDPGRGRSRLAEGDLVRQLGAAHHRPRGVRGLRSAPARAPRPAPGGRARGAGPGRLLRGAPDRRCDLRDSRAVRSRRITNRSSTNASRQGNRGFRSPSSPLLLSYSGRWHARTRRAVHF